MRRTIKLDLTLAVSLPIKFDETFCALAFDSGVVNLNLKFGLEVS